MNSENFGAVNVNGRRFLVTGKTVMKNGRVIEWDDWKNEAVAPGTVVEAGGTKITYLTCTDMGEPDREAIDEQIGEMMDDPDFWIGS